MEQIEIMNELVKHSQNANIIKENTRDYGDNSNWFELRKLRFTASLFNKLGDFTKNHPKD